jgi:hypothetical protein
MRAATIRQRKELTFRHNAGIGRHGWLRLTPAYSVKVVEDILDEERGARRVFDPFCGTGTTALAAASRGLSALSVDINPFLVWLGTLKTRRFTDDELARARSALDASLRRVAGSPPAPAPPIHNLERWWAPEKLGFLCRLKAAIARACATEPAARDLLTVAFCRTMIGLSNAAFNHQSMSFKRPTRTSASRVAGDRALAAGFLHDAELVLAGAADNPPARARIRRDDSRTLASVPRGAFDVLVTSPPYPNRMSYIRELRPYMYWTGFLNEAREAGELDWQAIGGTWGAATSRLSEWRPSNGRVLPRRLCKAIAEIARSDAKNAELLATYVAKYFHDMADHVAAVAERIASGGRVHYVVGNSTFYGVLVAAEKVFAELFAEHGFRDVQIRVLRKRNSKKELFEYDVVAARR